MTGFYMKQVFPEMCFWTDCSNIHIQHYLLSSFIYFGKVVFYLLWVFKMILWINIYSCWCKYFPNPINWSNGLVVKSLDSQSRGSVFKTTGWILPRSTKWVPGISGNLDVKSKLPPQSGSSLEAVEPNP